MSEADIEDTSWYDQVKDLPGGDKILMGSAAAALKGEPFKYFKKGEVKLSSCSGVPIECFNYYFGEFRRWSKFGLPHGQGYLNELPWVIDFFAYFDDLKKSFEGWNRNPASSGDVDPGIFGG